MNINNSILKVFETFGYSLELSDEAVAFLPLNLKISGELEHLDDSNPETVSSRLIIKVRHEKFFPHGIFEYSYGFGKDAAEAIEHAIFRWIELDFNAFHDLLCESKAVFREGNKLELVSISTNGGILGWEVVLTDIIHLESETQKVKINQDEIYLDMLDLITGSLLCEKGVYGIKYFAMQDESGNIQLDCRLNGIDWEEGRRALGNYVLNWGIQNELHWRKQYVLIVNKELDQLKNKDKLMKELVSALEQQLDEQKKKEPQSKFNWKFWRKK